MQWVGPDLRSATADAVMRSFLPPYLPLPNRPSRVPDLPACLHAWLGLQVMPTPLTRLRWWRVCLDEAQMVESSTAKAAEMALKLQTVHRW